MATIRKITKKVFGKDQTFKINYSAKFARFEVGLPEALDNFAIDSQTDYPTGKSEKEVLEELDKFIHKYETTSTTQRKVIGYRFNWSSKNIESKVASGHRSDYHPTTDEAQIEFMYLVMLEKEVGGTKRYFELRGEDTMELGYRDFDAEKDKLIDWTPERESFMKTFYASMEKLMNLLEEFVGSEELLIAAVDKNIKLLEKL